MLRRLLPIVLLLAGGAATALLVKSRPKPVAVEIQEKVWSVAVITAQPQRLSPTLTLYARVESPRAATLRAAISADVVQVKAREGDNANVGDLLVQLDPADMQWQLVQREADVAELRAELVNEDLRLATDRAALNNETKLAELAQRAVERAERLATRELGSAALLDEAKQDAARQSMNVDARRFAITGHQSRAAALNARLARAQSLESMARVDLRRTQIRAPFKARIASVSVAPGDRVRVGDALVDAFDPQAIELRAQVPSDYLAALRAGLRDGQPASASALVDGVAVRARLDRMSARIDRGRAGADALFSLDQEAASMLELGRTVQLSVSLAAVDKVVPIPAEALYGVNQIYLLIDSRMHVITVQRVGDFVDHDGAHHLLVRSDQISADSEIVVTQLPSATEGLKVRVVP